MEQHIDLLFRFYTSNQLNFENLISDAKKNNGIMPFVGEALSKCTFGSRDDFVNEIQDKTVTVDKTNEMDMDIRESSFLDVLDSLIRIHRKGVIDQKLLSFYSDLKIDDKYIKNQAVSLIPYINGNHCITANIDRVIDHSYNIAGKSPDVTHPFERKKLTTLVRGGIKSSQTNIVLKIHGDILSDLEHRILTKEDYQSHYNESSMFYKTISQWIQNYIILFIGVDICKDNYLFNLLKKLKSPGAYHYAFIGCKDDDKIKEQIFESLEEIGILSVLYDEDKPECLEMLLHKFLIDTNNIPTFSQGEIDYKYSHQDLIGREEQIKQLVSFLNKDDRILWTIINGNRLTGRTKLVYDFSRLYASNWEWYILEPEEIEEFMDSQAEIQKARKKDRNLLVTFDNFHWYKGSFDKIFNSEVCLSFYSKKIRFIFVLYDIKQSTLWKTLNSTSHDALWRKIIKSADRPLPINVNPLSVNEIMQLCHGYIYYRGYQLGIEKKIDELFSLIDDELNAFILELYNSNSPNILALSQLKAINLVKKANGFPYLNDSELAEVLFQLTITTENPPPNITDFDYERWLLDKNERDQNVSLTKEYFKNKEIHTDIENFDNFEESEMSRMLINLSMDDYKSNYKGDDKNK